MDAQNVAKFFLQMVDPKIFVVEGGIASGKSSFLSFIDGMYIDGKQVVSIYEPVGTWCKTPHGNILKEFIENKKKRAFSFQTLGRVSNKPKGVFPKTHYISGCY